MLLTLVADEGGSKHAADKSSGGELKWCTLLLLHRVSDALAVSAPASAFMACDMSGCSIGPLPAMVDVVVMSDNSDNTAEIVSRDGVEAVWPGTGMLYC